LRTAEAADIVRFARVWREPAMIGAPTSAGLCKKIVEVVTTEPGRFVSEAPRSAACRTTSSEPSSWACARRPSRASSTFDWSPVLDLLRVVAVRPREDTDADRWLRISVARLLAAGFANGAGEIPASARSEVWGIIRPIAMEAGPAPAGSGDPDGSNRVGRSVAAEGLQAVVRYALWVRRQIEGQPGAGSSPEPVGNRCRR